MSNQFKVGDTVTLKSGSPTMTVEQINGGRVFVQWFDGKNELKHGDFPADSLQEDDMEPPGIY